MDQKPLNLTNVKVIANMDWKAVPADQLFDEKGKPVVLGDSPWNLEEFSGKKEDRSKCIMIHAEFEAPKDGIYILGAAADWLFKIWIDNDKVIDGHGWVPLDPEDHCVMMSLNKGKHIIRINFSRGQTANMALFLRYFGEKAISTVDLKKTTGRIRKELHGSSTTLILSSRNGHKYEEPLKKLNFTWARTHDWPLWNPGQRLIDTHFIFPLMKLDPKDPTNYYFAPTDEIIRLTQDVAGIKVFYRLGTSIEHTGDPHFNAIPPDDYEKYAEVLAGIVRHYTRGWANGFHYDIKYWEIWTEPEGIGTLWTRPYAETFPKFFVTVYKRLKSEFPDLQFGGPAFCWYEPMVIIPLLNACKEAGIEPDFLSWHCYTTAERMLIRQPARARKELDEMGFPNMKLCIDEWHYVETWEGIGASASPEVYRKAIMDGPNGMQGIHSGVFNLAVLIGWQDSPLDLGMWYGAGWDSPSWGYRNAFHEYTKNYYSMQMFGDFLKDYPVKCQVESFLPYILAGRSEDGAKAGLLVADYKGRFDTLEIQVAGLADYTKVSAAILDETRNYEPVPVMVKDGKIILQKNGTGSAAFMIRLEK